MKAGVVILAAVLLLPMVVSADEGRISVAGAINRAFGRNQLLKSAGFERTAAEQSVAGSRSRYFPQLVFEESAALANSPTRTFMMKLDQGRFTQQDFQIDNLNNPRSRADFRTSLSVSLPFFDAGVGGLVSVAEKDLEVYDSALERRKHEVAFQVFNACLEVQTAKAKVAAAEQAVKNSSEHYRLAQVRSSAGTGLKSDGLRAATNLAEAQQLLITADNDFRLSRLRLAKVVGEEPGESLDVEGQVSLPSIALDAEELKRHALKARPDLREARAQKEKAQAASRLARSTYLPTVYGGASYQLNDRDFPFGSDNDSWTAGIQLRWEIFDGFRRSTETAKARALQSAAEARMEDQRRDAVLQVTETLLRREEAEKRLEVALHALQGAEEAVRLLSRRYENSLATISELLQAQTALNNARARLVENESDYTRATAMVLHAAGLLVQEVGK